MTLHEAVQEQYVSENSTFCQGSPMLGADVCLEGFGEQQQQSYTKEQEEHMLQEAVQAAEEADIVVLAIGEDRLQSGEATSNANIRIPEVQEALLDRIAEVNQNIVVVLFSGRPLDIREITKRQNLSFRCGCLERKGRGQLWTLYLESIIQVENCL